jgi:CheY-like chemotaxis protein
LRAEGQDGWIRIEVTGRPASDDRMLDSDLVREILTTYGGSIEVGADDDQLILVVAVPSADEITVLVVDDNRDLVHFYRRYTAGTRYQIDHVAEGRKVFERIGATVPDVIVLDVMLPDIDGWELLGQLREHHATRGIPIIVCSVVRQEELALALGAALYLPKPVRRQQLLRALDQVCGGR